VLGGGVVGGGGVGGGGGGWGGGGGGGHTLHTLLCWHPHLQTALATV